MTKELWLNSWQEQEIFLFSTISRPALKSTQLCVQCPCLWTFWLLKMTTLCCLETLGTIHPVIWCHIPEEWIPQLCPCKNLKTCKSGCGSVLCCFLFFLRELIEQGMCSPFSQWASFLFLTSPTLFEWFQCLILNYKPVVFYATCYLRGVFCVQCITL